MPTKKIKHEVRVGFHFRDRNHKIILRNQKDADDPPIISIVRESFEYGEKFKINDLILSVNGKKIKTINEWFRIKEKLKWKQKIKFVLLRDKTKIVSTIQLKSFDEFKQKTIMIGVDVVKYLKNFVKVSNIDYFPQKDQVLKVKS